MKLKKVLTILSFVVLLSIATGCSTQKATSTNSSTENSETVKPASNEKGISKPVDSENKSSEQKFNKNDTDILKDLKDANAGIDIVDSFTCTITYGKNDMMGYIPIQKVNSFNIESISALTSTIGVVLDDVNLWKEVKIKTNVDFGINDPNDMYEINGEYNSEGTFVILYHLQKNNENKLLWTFSSVKYLSPEFKITKK